MRNAPSILLAVVLLAFPLIAQEHEHEHHADERLGTISFPVTCAPAAQTAFTRGVALLHSFWYEEAEKTFRRVAELDPQCGMAWWGVAMCNFHQVWPTPYTPAELQRGIDAAANAKRIGAKTPREQGYIDAIAILYDDAKSVALPQRARAYEAAMQRLSARFPDDDEAAIFYALILINHGMATPKDKTYAYQKQAAEILNGLLPRHADHPGIAHYLIHSFDYPALAPLALSAANAYAKIAPSSPHALHMPSHIYVRLGMWKETIDSNLASARAATDYANANHPGSTAFDALHADDYLTYAWLQRGEDDKVHALVQQLQAVKKLDTENFAGFYALAAVPARDAIERRRWSDAMALPVIESLPWSQYAYAESLTHFARALGAARLHEVAKAKESLARLAQLRQLLIDQKNPYWADQVDVQRREAEAWIARAEDRNGEALTLMQGAAELEDSMDKSPVTPGAIVPAREMLGDLLLELNEPAAALTAFETSLKNAPNRLNGLAGAARAAQLVGDIAKAREYYGKVARLLE